MPEKSSIVGILLGSAVVSAAISIGYNHFFVTKKDLLVRELNFITAMHTIVKEQDDKDEYGRLTFVTNVLHPLYKNDPQFAPVISYYMKAKSRTSAEASGSIGNTLDAVLTRETVAIADLAVLDTLQQKKLIPSEYDVANLRDALFSGYRRQLSDKLVIEIDNDNTDLPQKLVKAIISDDTKREYRVNLYIAYTLARSEKWTASQQEFESLANLKATNNYQDPTFKRHLDAALTKFQSQ